MEMQVGEAGALPSWSPQRRICAHNSHSADTSMPLVAAACVTQFAAALWAGLVSAVGLKRISSEFFLHFPKGRVQ